MLTVDRLIIELQKLQHTGHGSLPICTPQDRGIGKSTHEICTEVNVSEGEVIFFDNKEGGCSIKKFFGPHVLIEWN